MMSAEAAPKTPELDAQSTPPPASEKKALSISITPRAVEAIKKQIAKRNVPGTALRVGVKGGGCSGYSYVIQFHDGEPHTRDIVYDLKAEDGTPVRVVIDKKSLLFLNGTELEWEHTLMAQGFKFKNPNEKSNCGCGHSFTV
jgi:iron-sulfur cluster assembly protein